MTPIEPHVDPHIFQLLVQQMKDYALFVLDAEGYIQTWNMGAQRLKGYAPHEIIGKHFSTFYPREALDRKWPEHELKMAAAEGRFEDEGWRVRKDGSHFWASIVLTALRDENGKLLGFSKITRDLTERQRQAEVLRESEERFRLLIEGVQDYAIYMLTPDGIVSSWNAGAKRIKGYEPDEIIGKHFSRFYAQEDVDSGKPWAELAEARRAGRAEDQGWRIRKDGQRFWARVVVSALYDANGQLRGFAKVTQDLTERRHVQDLEKAAKNVNEFIATLAHELRNPLAPIRSAVQLMAVLPEGDPRHSSLRDMIDRQSMQLVHVVDDLVDTARISRGMLTMEHDPLDVKELVRRSVETSMPHMESAGHTLEVSMDEGPCMVSGDMNRLVQLLSNLLNNAARYTPNGGHIRVHARAEGNTVAISVRDNGRGIDPSLMRTVFDMFVQGKPALHRVGAGMGIGLALARRIAEAHGGSLQARSEGQNRGAEFTLRLPRLRTTAIGNAAPSASIFQRAPARSMRVLVVDDNADVAASMGLQLENLGQQIRIVHDGTAALEAVEQFQPEVVLLDIGMPDLDGFEVARRLRAKEAARSNEASAAEPKPPRMHLVALTGWGQENDRLQSSAAGFDHHLVKPVEAAALGRLLHELGSPEPR